MESDYLEKTRVDIVGRNCKKAREFHDYAARTLYADDGTFDAFERTFGYAYALAFVKLLCDVFQVKGVITHDLANLHEVGHGFFGDRDRVSGGFVPHEVGGAVLPHSAEIVVDEGFCGADETEVRDSRGSHFDGLAIPDYFLAGHRHEMLDAVLAQHRAELQHPTIGYSYRKPIYCLIIQHIMQTYTFFLRLTNRNLIRNKN